VIILEMMGVLRLLLQSQQPAVEAGADGIDILEHLEVRVEAELVIIMQALVELVDKETVVEMLVPIVVILLLVEEVVEHLKVQAVQLLGT
jgi:hypothetical protein